MSEAIGSLSPSVVTALRRDKVVLRNLLESSPKPGVTEPSEPGSMSSLLVGAA